MKQKDKMKWAREIARYQKVIDTSTDKQTINEAQTKLIEIVSRIESIDPLALLEIDPMVQMFLKA